MADRYSRGSQSDHDVGVLAEMRIALAHERRAEFQTGVLRDELD